MVGNILNFLIGMKDVTDLVKDTAYSFAKDSISASIKKELIQERFGASTSSLAVNDYLTNDLKKLKQNTIFGDGVFKNAQSMLDSGARPVDVMPDLKMLGDLSMGDEQRMERLVEVFGHIREAGKLTRYDLQEIINDGFNPLQVMSENTGKSMKRLQTEMNNGKISFQDVKDAMLIATGAGGEFEGALDKMSNTAAGKMELAKESMETLKAAVGDILIPVVSIAGEWLNKFVSSFETPVTQQIQDQIVQIGILHAQITDGNTPFEERIRLLNELEKINPKITEGIDKQAISFDTLANNIQNVTEAMAAQQMNEVLKKQYQGIFDKLAEASSDYATLHTKVYREIGSLPGIRGNPNLSEAQRVDATIEYYKSIRADARKKLKEYEKNGKDAWDDLEAAGVASSRSAYSGKINNIGENYKKLLDLRKKIDEDLKPKAMAANQDISETQKWYSSFLGFDVETKESNKKKDKEEDKEENKEGDKSGGKNNGRNGYNSARLLTNSGPRQIVINGLNMKLADSIDVNANNVTDFTNQLEPRMRDMFLRILNSGATVQG